jgi:uncharacterized protein (DUF486 family)
MVPANRFGFTGRLKVYQLKIIQEVNTLLVFGPFLSDLGRSMQQTVNPRRLLEGNRFSL